MHNLTEEVIFLKKKKKKDHAESFIAINDRRNSNMEVLKIIIILQL